MGGFVQGERNQAGLSWGLISATRRFFFVDVIGKLQCPGPAFALRCLSFFGSFWRRVPFKNFLAVCSFKEIAAESVREKQFARAVVKSQKCRASALGHFTIAAETMRAHAVIEF